MAVASEVLSDGVHLHVYSKQRLSGSATDFTFNAYLPEVKAERDWNRVCIVDAVIPKSWYAIVAGANTFTLNESGAITTITVPAGNYTRSQWIAQVPPLMTAASAALGHNWTYTAQANLAPDTGTLTYLVAGNGGVQPVIGVLGWMDDQVGFPQNTTHSFVNNQLSTVEVYSQQSDIAILITTNLCVTDGNDNVLGAVCDVGQYSPLALIKFQAQHPILQSKRFQRTKDQNYTMQLISVATGKTLNLNGQDWYVHLKIYRSEDRQTNLLAQILQELQTPPQEVKALPLPQEAPAAPAAQPTPPDEQPADLQAEEPEEVAPADEGDLVDVREGEDEAPEPSQPTPEPQNLNPRAGEGRRRWW
jgi:hypothetical protein